MFSYLHTEYERVSVPPLGFSPPYSSHGPATLNIKTYYLKKHVRNYTSTENKNLSKDFLFFFIRKLC